MGTHTVPVEFESVPFDISSSTEPASDTDAPRLKRLAALIIDLSLFAALALALSPLLPASRNPWSIGALAGFVVVVSYYYYAGTWMLWGKTIGGTIFDVRVVPAHTRAMSLKSATLSLPTRSSSGRNTRPWSGATPSSENRLADTRAPSTRSGSPSPVMTNPHGR